MIFELGKRTLFESFDTVGATLKTRYLFARKYSKAKKVLDIGCAAGYGSYFLATEGKAKSVTGVDISKKALAQAQKVYKAPNLKFIAGQAELLPFPNHSFELVTCFEVIEHIPCPQKLLSEIARICQPDGLTIISTPNKAYTSPDTKLPILPFHVREFLENDFTPMLERHFGKVSMFYLKTVTPGHEAKRNKYLQSRQFQLVKKSSQIKLVRTLALYTPQALNDWVTGCNKVRLDSQKEEVKIARGLKNPHGFVAICEAPRP